MKVKLELENAMKVKAKSEQGLELKIAPTKRKRNYILKIEKYATKNGNDRKKSGSKYRGRKKNENIKNVRKKRK